MAEDRIPTREELADHDGLDERWMLKNFLGKSADEAFTMIAACCGRYTEDLTYMSARGLEYYLPAFDKYAKDGKSRDDFDFASGTICSLSCRAGERLPFEIKAKMKHLAAFIRDNQEKFGLDLNEEPHKSWLKEIEEKL